MDSTFGTDSAFRDAIGEKYYYLANVRSDTLLWTEQPQFSYPPYKGRGPRPKKMKPPLNRYRLQK